MSLQSMIRWLVPKEDHFYGFLEEQAVAAYDGAVALRRFKEGDSAQVVRDAVQKLEHDGDKIARAMEEALAKTFVTPIDREDLQRLSVELDDILDLTNGAIRAAVLYGVDRPTEPMIQLMDILVQCTEVLKTTLPNLRKNKYAEITESARTIRTLEKKGDAIFRGAVSALFHDADVDGKRLLREKEVLEDLENAVDYCETVGKSLANLAVKHG